MSRPKLGQVFLIDTNVVQKIVQSVCLNSTDNVIEIGCGDGILTSALADELNMLTVIEIDESCIQRSQDQLGIQKGISWVHQDVLTYDFSEQGIGIRVVANIPYYISSPLIQRFAYDKQRFKDITLMVQKEFAQKAVGKPGNGWCGLQLRLLHGALSYGTFHRFTGVAGGRECQETRG